MYGKVEVVKSIVELMKGLEMQISEESLMKKLEDSNKQKDQLYKQRQGTIDEINKEIQLYDRKIKSYQNSTDNILKPQL